MASIQDPTEWTGKEATVKIGDTIDDDSDGLASVSGSEILGNQMTNDTDYSGDIRDISIADPEAGVEVEDTFGGQIKAESPPDLVTVDFTFRLTSNDIFTEQHESGTTYSTASDTWTRVSGTAPTGSRPRKAILFHLEKDIGGTNYQMNYLMNDAIFVQDGEISLDADGNAELTASASCLVEDRHIERNF